MTAVFFDYDGSDEAKRKLLFRGQLLVYSPSRSSLALVEFARELIREAFGALEPRDAQHSLPVEEYVAILSQLKPKFINHPTSKDLVRGILSEVGCDPDKTYFDVPRMRTATSGGYLTSGIAYAFHPHRDTWYSGPINQINWWMPIYDIEPDSSMAFHPRYWYTPIENESNEFNYYEYVQTSRKDAAKHVKKDTRKQPRPTAPVELNPQIRVIARAGGVLLFSGAHLHSTVPNTTGRTRFSIDFRTVHLDDVAAKKGAPNIDSACTGTALRDFVRASDLSRIPEELVVPYEGMPDISPSLDEVG
jgi:hypothetical protein